MGPRSSLPNCLEEPCIYIIHCGFQSRPRSSSTWEQIDSPGSSSKDEAAVMGWVWDYDGGIMTKNLLMLRGLLGATGYHNSLKNKNK